MVWIQVAFLSGFGITPLDGIRALLSLDTGLHWSVAWWCLGSKILNIKTLFVFFQLAEKTSFSFLEQTFISNLFCLRTNVISHIFFALEYAVHLTFGWAVCKKSLIHVKTFIPDVQQKVRCRIFEVQFRFCIIQWVLKEIRSWILCYSVIPFCHSIFNKIEKLIFMIVCTLIGQVSINMHATGDDDEAGSVI